MYDEKIERFSTDYIGVSVNNASGALISSLGHDDVGVSLPIPVDSVPKNDSDIHKINSNVRK